MGLDVSAYRKLKKLDVLFTEDGDAVNPDTREVLVEDDYVKFYVSRDFPAQAADVVSGAAYGFEDAEHVWSGGYGGYGNWREELAKLAGYDTAVYYRVPGYAQSAVVSHTEGAFKVDSGPFHELICFTDCDGTIGPTVCAKLAKDFTDWDERAKAVGGWFYQTFVSFREGFEFAADGGAIQFR
jgi:hypothetical protein